MGEPEVCHETPAGTRVLEIHDNYNSGLCHHARNFRYVRVLDDRVNDSREVLLMTWDVRYAVKGYKDCIDFIYDKIGRILDGDIAKHEGDVLELDEIAEFGWGGDASNFHECCNTYKSLYYQGNAPAAWVGLVTLNDPSDRHRGFYAIRATGFEL